MSALNGLGYLYFYGQGNVSLPCLATGLMTNEALLSSSLVSSPLLSSGVPKNETKAFYYFLAAAEKEVDSDSLFNAGHCLQHGLGIPVDSTMAVSLFTKAAKKFGNFDAISRLAVMHVEGYGVTRSATEALMYLKVAASIGPWASWMRRGLDLYLAGIQSSKQNQGYLKQSLLSYMYAAEFGVEIGQSNAAFILSRKSEYVRLSDDSVAGAVLEERHLANSVRQNNVNSIVQLGDLYFRLAKGQMPLESRKRLLLESMWWYTRASSRGHPLGSYYAGIMHQFGLGGARRLQRAVRYYNLALQQGGFADTGSESESEDGDQPASASLLVNLMTSAAKASQEIPGYSIGTQSMYTRSSAFWSILRFLRWLALTDPSYATEEHSDTKSIRSQPVSLTADSLLSYLTHAPLKFITDLFFTIQQ